jgi:hypothetical protein
MAKKITTQPKRYVVIDEEESSDAIIVVGTLEEIRTELENEWIDKMSHDWDTDKWLSSLNIYELTKPSKLKYTRAKLEIK